MAQIKNKYGFKVMWEIQDDAIHDNPAEVIEGILPFVDIFSINDKEGMELFKLSSAKEVGEFLKGFDKPCFYRMGKEGSALISDGKIHFVPSLTINGEVDPTGCGNCSTAAALYAFCEGHDPYLIAILANIAAGYNVGYKGVISEFTEKMRCDALELAEKLRKDYHA